MKTLIICTFSIILLFTQSLSLSARDNSFSNNPIRHTEANVSPLLTDAALLSPTATFRLRHKVSRKTLAQYGWELDPKQLPVGMFADDTNDGSRWIFQDAGQGNVFIVNKASGLLLSTNSEDRSNRFAGVWQKAVPTHAGQVWKLHKQANGEFLIVNLLQNLGLTQYDGGRGSRVEGTVWHNPTASEDGFLWHIEPAGEADMMKVTILNVKCIKPSTGQDGNTAILFTGIEIGIQAAFAAASGGSSVIGSAAFQAGKIGTKAVVKAGIKAGVKKGLKKVGKKLYAANKQEIQGFVGLGGIKRPPNSSGEIAETSSAEAAVDLMSLQGVFNKLYPESPDDLYLNVNGHKVFPTSSAKSVPIGSQQTINIGSEYVFEKSKGVTLSIMEYDYGSNDDELGAQFFEVPTEFVGFETVVDQVFDDLEGEGSLYLVTFRIEDMVVDPNKMIAYQEQQQDRGATPEAQQSFNKNINVVGSTWTYNLQGMGSMQFVFGETTLDKFPAPNVTWKAISGNEVIFIFNNMRGSMKFDSPNSFTGTDWGGKTISGTRVQQQGQQQQQQPQQQNQQAQQQQYQQPQQQQNQQAQQQSTVSTLVGTAWTLRYQNVDYPFTFGQGIFNNQAAFQGMTWQMTGTDQITISANGQPTMQLNFNTPNSFTGKDVNGGMITGGRGGQQQQQQQQYQQQSFISNIIGTAWNLYYNGQNYPFVFGQGGTINNQPNLQGYTWSVIGANQVLISAGQQAVMSLNFNSMTTFMGNAQGGVPVSGTKQ